MLVLTRKANETIMIGDLMIVVKHIGRNRVSIAVEAKPGVKVLRGELVKKDQAA